MTIAKFDRFFFIFSKRIAYFSHQICSETDFGGLLRWNKCHCGLGRHYRRLMVTPLPLRSQDGAYWVWDVSSVPHSTFWPLWVHHPGTRSALHFAVLKMGSDGLSSSPCPRSKFRRFECDRSKQRLRWLETSDTEINWFLRKFHWSERCGDGDLKRKTSNWTSRITDNPNDKNISRLGIFANNM